MKRNRPLSKEARTLVQALADTPLEWRYGYDLIKATDLKSGTLYPILMRLTDRGLLEAKWLEAETLGRPQRHAYKLTPAGRSLAAQLTSDSASDDVILEGQPA
jgi:PadR family transcriptional regulator PadR